MSKKLYIHQKRYENHYGLDLKSTDLNRDPKFASLILNAQYKKSGGIEKRPGFQFHAEHDDNCGLGLFVYNKKNPTTGASEAEVVSVGVGASRLLFCELEVEYVGADPTAVLNLFFDPDEGEYYCQILEGSSLVVDEPLGLGYDENPSVTVADLAAIINATTNFNASATGDTTVSAAFLNIVRDHDLSSSGENVTMQAGYWQSINQTVTSPFDNFADSINDDDFELMTGVQIQNCLYLAGGGKDYVHKYDGQTLYRAGLPSVGSLTSVLGASTGFTGSKYLYAARVIQYDAAGNIFEGNITYTSNEIDTTDDKVNVTVGNILANSGFNTNCAIANGAQAGVTTILVDSGHTMKVGDTAYFYDGLSGAYVEREVIGKDTTHITIDGSAVNIADNAVISNNLRIGLYRSKTSSSTPTVWYHLVDLPNDSFNSTQVYVDSKADTALGEQLIEPLTDRSVPPLLRYISMFQNQMVGGGNPVAKSTLYWSDVDGCEYFPSSENSQNLDTIVGDDISGIFPNNEILAVFKDKSINLVSGTMADNKLRFDWSQGDVGCIAHHTIRDIQGNTCWLSDRGPYRMVAGQIPTPLGENKDGGGRVEPLFDQTGIAEESVYKLKRAFAINDRNSQKYIIHLPCESLSPDDDVYTNENSVLIAWDYAKGVSVGSWLMWDKLDFSSGAVLFGDEFYFMGRDYTSYFLDPGIKRRLFRRLNLNDAWDYEDNHEAITWDYGTCWETAGDASVLKKFLKLRIYSADSTPNNEATLNVQTEADFISDSVKAEFDLDQSGSGYGDASYGDLPFGTPTQSLFEHKLGNGKFTSMRFRFHNAEHQQNVDIDAWETEIAAPYRPEFKK